MKYIYNNKGSILASVREEQNLESLLENWTDSSVIETDLVIDNILLWKVNIDTKELYRFITDDQIQLELKIQKNRFLRNNLLKSSDWTELPSVRAIHDAHWSESWDTYRQALRDLNFENPSWPIKPE